jgi:nucleotidyltransferase/DNA polymerase involved in DNA repair
VAFERLQALGETRWTLIRNELVRGEPAMSLARRIQQEWGEFQDVAEKTLTQQLSRLRQKIQEGAFGQEVAEKLEQAVTAKQKVEILNEFGTVNALEIAETLITLQMKRIQRLVKREEEMPMPLPSLNEMIMSGSKLAQDLQKMRFDLGLDEFCGVVSGFKGASASVTLPDGTHIQKQVYEAADVLNNIFDSRGIANGNGQH